MNNDSYGVKVRLIIDFGGGLEELCTIISNSLSIPSFWFDTMTEPPHESVGYCETFGFEIDVQKYKNELNSYVFSAITTNSFKEIAEGKIYDLSVWFSNYFSLVCKVRTRIAN